MDTETSGRTLVGHSWKELRILDDRLSWLSDSRKYLRYTYLMIWLIKLGDIGTSPLYVFTGYSSDDGSVTYRRIFPNSTGPAREDVVGAVSCIVWSLTLIPLIKYCWIVLRAGDDQGEGTTRLLLV